TTGMFAGTGRIDDMGWFDTDWAAPSVGGLKQANAWGLFDMHGNLMEWCADYLRNYPATAEVDPVGDGGLLKLFVVARGGDYRTDLALCRSAWRSGHKPSERQRVIGFRVALEISQQRR